MGWVTLFSAAKLFRGQTIIIQCHALKRGALLYPDVEITLFGDDEVPQKFVPNAPPPRTARRAELFQNEPDRLFLWPGGRNRSP